MATIYDVARHAGVSPATVSRVLNGSTVTAANREKVLASAAALDYRPDRAARTLRTRTTDVLGLIIPDIENPFFTALARGVEDVAHEAGRSVVLCNTDERADKEDRYVDVALAEKVAGVIIAPVTDGAALVRLGSRGVPVVLVDRAVPSFAADAVVLDNFDQSADLTRRLYDAGYRRVGCISGPRGADTAQSRERGWRAEYRRHHDDDPDRVLRNADWRVDSGRAAAIDLLTSRDAPDALFVANNLMSVGALRALMDLDRRPPAVGLASFGDLPFGLRDELPLLFADVPARTLGELAARQLLERITGFDGPPRHTVVRSDARLTATDPTT